MKLPFHIYMTVFAAFAVAGCFMFGASEDTVISSTEVISVGPSTGVWDEEYGRTDNPSDCSFEFQVIRRLDGLVVRATVFDNKVVTDNCEPGAVRCNGWDDDNIEVFFDGNNDRSVDAWASNDSNRGGEYILVANGAAYSDNSSCPGGFGKDWKGSASIKPLEDGGFKIDYELWFSWRCVGRNRPPRKDQDLQFGFNICVHDDDDGGRNDRALYWKGCPSMPYRNESAFGVINLKGVAK